MEQQKPASPENEAHKTGKERIIPITILSSKHVNADENDNKTNSKRLSMPTVPCSNNNPEEDSTTKRKSLLVTLDDGTTTETQGSVTQLRNAENQQTHTNLSIQEIGQDTLNRLSSGPKVRVVPIRLTDGKVVQKAAPEESMQIKAEFTNFTHQEFNDDEEKVIPRMDEPNEKAETKSRVESQRVVPIKMVETGETIMPSYSQLEEPRPPDWSTFSKLNKAKERVVPLEQRGRDRVKATPPTSPPRSQSASKKGSVRFDLESTEAEKEKERRSSSVETFSRKTTTTTTTKPPTVPKKWAARPSSMERPASAMAISPTTERTLQEIDRDINQIWQELQELEKLPNGSYRPKNPITPVKIKASYTPTASKVVLNNASETTPSSAPPTRRTIWDMESKSTPVTPNLSKKLDTPTRKLEVPRGPPPPIPPHLRPTQIPMAPIARDESFYDIASKSPSTASCYDNEYSPNSGKFKGFPYIDGAPRKRSSEGSPMKQNETDFSLLVDKSTQTQLEQEKRKSKDACAIL